MVSAEQIAADPSWLPHHIDVQNRTVEFLKVPEKELGAVGFLADRTGETVAASWEDVQAMRPDIGPICFIFHTAFCRSTLLVRALNEAHQLVGLNEPGIIASLVNAGAPAKALLEPVIALLSRPWSGGGAVFVKATNHANMLMPGLAAAQPDAKIVLMTNSLAAFLQSVARKGMMGRRWGRQLYVELQTYARMDFGMDPRETFAMTDLQAAGLAWFLNQYWFANFRGAHDGDRVRVLDGDRFNDERERTMRSVMALAGLEMSAGEAQTIAAGPVFSSHSKLGGSFDGEGRGDRLKTSDPFISEEIQKVTQWVRLIAKEAGLTVPLPHDLF